MKKIVKKTLILVGSIVLLPLALTAIRIIQIKSDLGRMAPLETGEVVKGVYSLKDSRVNMYLVKTSNTCIAIDAGNDTENIRKELKRMNVNPADVAAVFLTHSDADHVGALDLFQKARIYLSKQEVQMIDGSKSRFLVFKNQLKFVYTVLDDNETIHIDSLKIMAVSTPGHTPGSMCYVVDGQYLFTGDSMGLRSGKADIFSKTINMDNKTQRESMQKLASLTRVKYIFTAHHGYSDSFDNVFNNNEKAKSSLEGKGYQIEETEVIL